MPILAKTSLCVVVSLIKAINTYFLRSTLGGAKRQANLFHKGINQNRKTNERTNEYDTAGINKMWVGA